MFQEAAISRTSAEIRAGIACRSRSSYLYDRYGQFAERLTRAFGMPWFRAGRTAVIVAWDGGEFSSRSAALRPLPVHSHEPRLSPVAAYAALILFAETHAGRSRRCPCVRVIQTDLIVALRPRPSMAEANQALACGIDAQTVAGERRDARRAASCAGPRYRCQFRPPRRHRGASAPDRTGRVGRGGPPKCVPTGFPNNPATEDWRAERWSSTSLSSSW
jgi:hypothetical protein